jgi:hypothetical protein
MCFFLEKKSERTISRDPYILSAKYFPAIEKKLMTPEQLSRKYEVHLSKITSK